MLLPSQGNHVILQIGNCYSYSSGNISALILPGVINITFTKFYRPCQKEGNPSSASVDAITCTPGSNSNRYKPKPPPRNPNTTKTCGNGYYASNEIVPYHDANSQRKLAYSRTIAQGSGLTHDDFINNPKALQCNTESERIRDIGAEDADVSSQSSSSGVNVRSCTRLSTNIGKVKFSTKSSLTVWLYNKL